MKLAGGSKEQKILGEGTVTAKHAGIEENENISIFQENSISYYSPERGIEI